MLLFTVPQKPNRVAWDQSKWERPYHTSATKEGDYTAMFLDKMFPGSLLQRGTTRKHHHKLAAGSVCAVLAAACSPHQESTSPERLRPLLKFTHRQANDAKIWSKNAKTTFALKIKGGRVPNWHYPNRSKHPAHSEATRALPVTTLYTPVIMPQMERGLWYVPRVLPLQSLFGKTGG